MQLFKVVLKQEMDNNNPLSISYIYNGKLQSKPEFAAIAPDKQIIPIEKDSAKSLPPEVKKELKDEEKKPTAGQTSLSPSAKIVIIKPTDPIPDELKDVVVYRIQFLSTTKPRNENQIVINGVAYNTYEYFYLDAYRYSLGEFATLAPAKELQVKLRQSGYPQAFIAAFKNNMRSLDLSAFK